jgi:hypothetical protein
LASLFSDPVVQPPIFVFPFPVVHHLLWCPQPRHVRPRCLLPCRGRPRHPLLRHAWPRHPLLHHLRPRDRLQRHARPRCCLPATSSRYRCTDVVMCRHQQRLHRL